MLIRKSEARDFQAILAIINDAACVYRGLIPVDRWREPYMPADELANEIASGVVFWVAEHEELVSAVMGIQDKGDVSLVRHAYVAPAAQRSGIGTMLLRHVEGLTDKPILIGTCPLRHGRSSSIVETDSAWSRKRKRTACSGHTGQFLRGRSRRRLYLPIAGR